MAILWLHVITIGLLTVRGGHDGITTSKGPQPSLRIWPGEWPGRRDFYLCWKSCGRICLYMTAAQNRTRQRVSASGRSAVPAIGVSQICRNIKNKYSLPVQFCAHAFSNLSLPEPGHFCKKNPPVIFRFTSKTTPTRHQRPWPRSRGRSIRAPSCPSWHSWHWEENAPGRSLFRRWWSHGRQWFQPISGNPH